MQVETVDWFVGQKYNDQCEKGDYDILTVLQQKPKTILLRTLANKIVSKDPLGIDIANHINSFLPVIKGVVVKPDKDFPSVISLENLVDFCEKIVFFTSDDIESSVFKYEIIRIAKAYLQTIDRYDKLTHFQFEFIRDNLVSRGFVICPGRCVTFYGIIGYLVGDREWIDTYLNSHTATFACEEDSDVCTHISSYQPPYGNDDIDSDDNNYIDYHNYDSFEDYFGYDAFY
jgi:hypothetical protein